MSASPEFSVERSTGYRLDQLARAFDRVRDMRDWQVPIWAVIDASERALVEQAVVWFTDSLPVFEAVPGSDRVLVVKAPGYREGSLHGVPERVSPPVRAHRPPARHELPRTAYGRREVAG